MVAYRAWAVVFIHILFGDSRGGRRSLGAQQMAPLRLRRSFLVTPRKAELQCVQHPVAPWRLWAACPNRRSARSIARTDGVAQGLAENRPGAREGRGSAPVPYGPAFWGVLCRSAQVLRKSLPTGHRCAGAVGGRCAGRSLGLRKPHVGLHVTHIAGRNAHIAYGVDAFPGGPVQRQGAYAGSSNRFGRGALVGIPIGGTCAILLPF